MNEKWWEKIIHRKLKNITIIINYRSKTITHKTILFMSIIKNKIGRKWKMKNERKMWKRNEIKSYEMKSGERLIERIEERILSVDKSIKDFQELIV